jgi:hypothetical protein
VTNLAIVAVVLFAGVGLFAKEATRDIFTMAMVTVLLIWIMTEIAGVVR